MKFSALFLATALIPFCASAGELTYKLDLAHSKMDAETAHNFCGLPDTLRLNASEDLPTVVIKKTQSLEPEQLKIQYIQASSGSMLGGDLEEPYRGDYRVRVALVRTAKPTAIYPAGVFQRVEVITYGSTAAPKSFTVETDLLNYRESAELGESVFCNNFAYRLQ